MFVCELCGYKSKSQQYSYALYRYRGSSKDISDKKQVCWKCYKESKEK